MILMRECVVKLKILPGSRKVLFGNQFIVSNLHLESCTNCLGTRKRFPTLTVLPDSHFPRILWSTELQMLHYALKCCYIKK